MSYSNMPGSGKNEPKDNSGTESDAEVQCSPHDTKNIEPSIQQRVQETAASEKFPKMDWEPTATQAESPAAAQAKSPTAAQAKSPTTTQAKSPAAAQAKSPAAAQAKSPAAAQAKSPAAAQAKSPAAAQAKSPTAALANAPAAIISSVSKKLDDMKIEDIPSIIEDYFKGKLSSDHSFSKPSCSKLLSPEKNKNVSMKPTTEAMTKTSTGLNIAGPSSPKAPLQNPSIKTQADHGSSTAVASGSKPPAPKQLELPLPKRTMKDTSDLADACRFFLNFMKSKRTDLMYKEGELDKCTADIQKALKDSEQICLKLENEPETLPEEMSAAVTQAQKLAYLLTISYRSFKKLDELGSKLHGQLQSYTKESEMFHESADRLLQYIVETIFEKCKQSL